MVIHETKFYESIDLGKKIGELCIEARLPGTHATGRHPGLRSPNERA